MEERMCDGCCLAIGRCRTNQNILSKKIKMIAVKKDTARGKVKMKQKRLVSMIGTLVLIIGAVVLITGCSQLSGNTSGITTGNTGGNNTGNIDENKSGSLEVKPTAEADTVLKGTTWQASSLFMHFADEGNIMEINENLQIVPSGRLKNFI